MRPPRRILPSTLCSIVAVFFFALAARATIAQTPGQLPHAWSEAVFTLAEKISAALGTSHTFALELNEVSTVAAIDPASLRQTLEDDLALRGAKSSAAPADAQVQVTISQNLAGFVLVAEIRRQDAQQVAVVPVATSDELPPQPGPEPGIQRKIVWQQAVPILDFLQVSADSHRMLLYFLEPDRLVAYEFDDGAQVLRDAQPVARRYPSRDLRGHLIATDAMHVSAFLAGMRCDGSWNPSFSVECRENAGQQWPMGTVSWASSPARNYFQGSITFSNDLQAKFPPFFSSASPSPETTGLSSSRRIVAGLDGQAELFVGNAEPASNFEGWGSDVVSIASGCGSAWQVLVTGSGDWTEKDQIQLYEVRDRGAAAIGEPFELTGPILALWAGEDGRSARVISRNLESGMYEASMVSVSCSN
jgi:hypothetical protein